MTLLPRVEIALIGHNTNELISRFIIGTAKNLDEDGEIFVFRGVELEGETALLTDQCGLSVATHNVFDSLAIRKNMGIGGVHHTLLLATKTGIPLLITVAIVQRQIKVSVSNETKPFRSFLFGKIILTEFGRVEHQTLGGGFDNGEGFHLLLLCFSVYVGHFTGKLETVKNF
jgi:hypothetical protein